MSRKTKQRKQAQILQLIEEAKKGYQRYKNDFAKLEEGYLNILDPKLVRSLKIRRKSHITPQIIRAKVRRVAISIMKTYFENDRFAAVTPETFDKEIIEQASRVQARLDVWTTKKINLYSRFKPAVIDALVYGTAIAKVWWGKGGLRVSRVKVRDLYIDPNATNVEDIQYCVHRVTTTVGKLRRQYGRKFKWKNYIGQHENGKLVTIDIGDASRVEVLDVYRYEGGKWLVSTVLPDQTFIRTDVELKDGLPFVIGNVEPQFIRLSEGNAVEAYGGSFIEPMIPLQEEYTVTRNQQIDAIDGIFQHRFLATRESGLKEEDLTSNRKKITVSNLNMVKELPIPRIDPSIFGIDRLDSEMQEVSGVTKYNQGLNDPKNLNQTATGVSILTEEGNAVIADITRALNESFFEPAVRRMARLIWKYDEAPELYGIDRSAVPLLHVQINAGVGAVNNELLLNNISAAEGVALQLANTYASLGDAVGAQRYLRVLDALFEEKLKALKLKTIIPIAKGEDDERERIEDSAAGAVIGDGTAGGNGGDQGVAGLPGAAPGDGAEIQ
ncbi:portal protein [Nitratifractor sp.]